MKKDMTAAELERLVEEVSDDCVICTDSKERKNRPKNCSLRATDFNEDVANDLTEWWCQPKNGKLIICHMVA